jgi:hypothetical protein
VLPAAPSHGRTCYKRGQCCCQLWQSMLRAIVGAARGDATSPLWGAFKVCHQSCNGSLSKLRWHDASAAILHHRSCNGASPELQWPTAGAAMVCRRSFNGLPSKLQWPASGEHISGEVSSASIERSFATRSPASLRQSMIDVQTSLVFFIEEKLYKHAYRMQDSNQDRWGALSHLKPPE